MGPWPYLLERTRSAPARVSSRARFASLRPGPFSIGRLLRGGGRLGLPGMARQPLVVFNCWGQPPKREDQQTSPPHSNKHMQETKQQPRSKQNNCPNTQTNTCKKKKKADQEANKSFPNRLTESERDRPIPSHGFGSAEDESRGLDPKELLLAAVCARASLATLAARGSRGERMGADGSEALAGSGGPPERWASRQGE